MVKKDRNFDKLVSKFEEKVYGTVKGEWRLKLLKEDLANLHAQSDLNIWDAGCGLAQISQWFAQANRGHNLTLCDLSFQMINEAQFRFEELGLSARFLHGPSQQLAEQLEDFDLILFHAVLEWLAEPKTTLQKLCEKVKPNGYLSLLFYNRNAIVYTNLLKGEWRWQHLLADAYMGKVRNLTPPHPHYPHEVLDWLTEWGFSVEAHTGIRVFHDYLTHEVREKSNEQELMALEYRYCRMPTYRDMGRYIHLLAKRDQVVENK
jgi:S-adenosylmethionine-dependent methyltransferase